MTARISEALESFFKPDSRRVTAGAYNLRFSLKPLPHPRPADERSDSDKLRS
jgi:hypothetical protein